jgi:murein DD-endopeptidase MepM/ murein hydrolase activator NlpD
MNIKNIISKLFIVSFLILSFLFLYKDTLSFGIKKDEIPEMQKIQANLTNAYLENDKNTVKLRILESKILESKIETLTLEDNINEYDKDIEINQKKMDDIFKLIKEPMKKLDKLKKEEIFINQQIKKNGKTLILIYLELNNQILEEKENNGGKTFIKVLLNRIDDTEQIKIKNKSLREIEKYILSVYKSLLEELKINKELQKDIENKIFKNREVYKNLTENKDKLQQQKELQEEILLQENSKKNEYTSLLRISREQMMQSMIDAVKIDSSLNKLNKELQELEEEKYRQKKLEAEKVAQKINKIITANNKDTNEAKNEITSVDLQLLKDIEISKPKYILEWPMYPKKGISAGFRGNDYYKRFKMHHNAIDIPAPQNSDVFSSANGYVYKAVDNGLGYSYIIILHKNNIRTLYGHISKILVKEGQMVSRGELIGKSGGQPGTKGAGKITTGPHLHFEVLVNEIYKNPLNFLDKSILK